MNDTELDELLNIWKAPVPRESLREGVRVGIEAKRRRLQRRLFTGWRLLSAAAVVVVAFMLANTNAFPEKVSPPPFTVDSQVIRYVGGSLNAAGPESALMTSYNDAGSEVFLSWSSPDHPLEAAFREAMSVVSGAVGRITRWLWLTPDQMARRKAKAVVHPTVGQSWDVGERATLVSSGCRSSVAQGKVVGEEVILNYPTRAVQHDIGGGRVMTLWMAPDLSCFALRATIEALQPDGSRTLVSEKKALKVTVNH